MIVVARMPWKHASEAFLLNSPFRLHWDFALVGPAPIGVIIGVTKSGRNPSARLPSLSEPTERACFLLLKACNTSSSRALCARKASIF